MRVIDLRHWLNDEQTGPGAPQLRLKTEKLAEIITYAIARDRDLVTGDPPKWWRRPNRKPCIGKLNVQFTEDDQIYWICPTCGDDGTIDGWYGLIRDVSFYDEEGRVVH